MRVAAVSASAVPSVAAVDGSLLIRAPPAAFLHGACLPMNVGISRHPAARAGCADS